MPRCPRTARGRLAAPALLLVLATAPLAAAAGGALPWDAWFVRRQLLFGERPAVSPDGRWVAYSVAAARPGGSQGTRYLPSGTPGPMDGARIELSATAGGTPRDPCPEEGSCWRPAWSPDGGRLAFFADAGGEVRLWVYDLGTGGSRRVADARVKPRLWPGDEARWSPDGRRLYVPLVPAGGGDGGPEAKGGPAAGKPEGEKDGAPAGPAVTVRRSGAEKEAAPEAGKAEAAPDDPMARALRRENASRLAAVDLASGRVEVLVSDTAEPAPSVLRLSPSGAWVSYLSVFRQEGGGAGKFPELVCDLAVVPAAGGPVHTLATGLKVVDASYFEANYRWHPREDRLVYLEGGKLFAVDLRGVEAGAFPEPRELAASLGKLAPAPLLFTADGRSLVVGVAGGGGGGSAGGGEVRALALVPLDGPARRSPVLLPLDPEHRRLVAVVQGTSRTAWQPADGALTLLEEDRATGETVAVRVDPATGRARELWRRLGRLRGTSALGPEEGSLAGVYEDPGTPPDVYRFGPELSPAGRNRISTVEPAFGAVRGVDVQVLETRVPGPGGELRPVRTAILLPAGTAPGAHLPAVVAIYPGEPVSRSAGHFAGGDFTTLPNLLFTSRGYAVVLPDLPLGPEGEPGEPLREMVDALLPQLQHAADAGWIDASRLGLLGQSYGGYAAAAIVSRTSLFRAAVAISGIFDLPGVWGLPDRDGTSFFREWVEDGQGHMGGPPWAELPRYLANSPYFQVEHIHTPLLLVHGTEDDAVDESRKLFTALERLGRTAQYAEYPGEGHVVWGWKLADAADCARRVTEFLERYLGSPRELPAPGGK